MTAVDKEFAEKFPLHARLKELHADAQKVGDFLMWLGKQSWFICEASEGKMHHIEYTPVPHGLEALLALYYSLDIDALEAEKKQMTDLAEKSTSAR